MLLNQRSRDSPTRQEISSMYFCLILDFLRYHARTVVPSGSFAETSSRARRSSSLEVFVLQRSLVPVLNQGTFPCWITGHLLTSSTRFSDTPPALSRSRGTSFPVAESASLCFHQISDNSTHSSRNKGPTYTF